MDSQGISVRTSRLFVALASLVAALALACGTSDTPLPTTTPSASPTATPVNYQPTPQPSPLETPQAGLGTTLLIKNGTVIDGTGGDPVPNAYVLVKDGRIVTVGSGGIEPPPEAEIIDAGGGTIMPGLIDTHVHITRQLLPRSETGGGNTVDKDGLLPWLEEGITTLRDVGTARIVFPPVRVWTDDLRVHNRAPRVVWAGPMVTAPGGYPIPVGFDYVAQEVASVEEARSVVNTLADGGAGVIKLGLEQGYHSDEGWPLLSLEQVTAITEAAHARGLRVTAHVTSLDEVQLALDGGVDDLAHAPLEPIPDDLIQEMLGRGMDMATTATVWGEGGSRAASNAKRYADVGGTVSVATDFGCGGCSQPSGITSYLREIEFLAQGGMTPMQLY
jgi:imidazolonepropionase-like amidohydrolase